MEKTFGSGISIQDPQHYWKLSNSDIYKDVAGPNKVQIVIFQLSRCLILPLGCPHWNLTDHFYSKGTENTEQGVEKEEIHFKDSKETGGRTKNRGAETRVEKEQQSKHEKAQPRMRYGRV
jgi:hypothetical protein